MRLLVDLARLAADSLIRFSFLSRSLGRSESTSLRLRGEKMSRMGPEVDTFTSLAGTGKSGLVKI